MGLELLVVWVVGTIAALGQTDALYRRVRIKQLSQHILILRAGGDAGGTIVMAVCHLICAVSQQIANDANVLRVLLGNCGCSNMTKPVRTQRDATETLGDLRQFA